MAPVSEMLTPHWHGVSASVDFFNEIKKGFTFHEISEFLRNFYGKQMLSKRQLTIYAQER